MTQHNAERDNLIERLREMLDRERECTVCGGDGIKTNLSDCKGCGGSGRVCYYIGKDRATIIYAKDHIEQLTPAHGVVTDEMVGRHIDYLNDIGVYGLSKEGCRAALEAALAPQEPVASELPVVAWASQYSLDLVKEHPDQAWSMWGRPGGQATIPMTDHTEATRIITELRAERDNLQGRLFAESEAVQFYRAAAINNRKRAETAEAHVKALTKSIVAIKDRAEEDDTDSHAVLEEIAEACADILAQQGGQTNEA